MGGMRNEVIPPPTDVSQASGRTGISTLFGGPWRRPMLLVAALVVAFCTVAALRETDPTDPSEAAVAPQPSYSLPVRFTPSPTSGPRGSLPRPDVVDHEHNRLVGNVEQSNTEAGEQAAFVGVNQILNWYCPESVSLDSSIKPVDGWTSVQVIARPRPGTEFELMLSWTGAYYRWQGPKDALDKCW